MKVVWAAPRPGWLGPATMRAVALASPHLRAARLNGVIFVALFTLALTAMLGDLVGAFADSAESFTAYFDTSAGRLRHALGAYLLVASGLAFLGFAVHASAGFVDVPEAKADVRMVGLVAAVFVALVGLAAAALATVSLSVGFGQIFGDPGIQDGQELLPQLGYVILAVPAALSAAFAIWLLARLGSRTARWPRGVTTAGYVVALLQLLSFYTLPMLLLPLWVVAASISFREPSDT
jgi:hypothetical protein